MNKINKKKQKTKNPSSCVISPLGENQKCFTSFRVVF